jgi:hypothetical protein
VDVSQEGVRICEDLEAIDVPPPSDERPTDRQTCTNNKLGWALASLSIKNKHTSKITTNTKKLLNMRFMLPNQRVSIHHPSCNVKDKIYTHK